MIVESPAAHQREEQQQNRKYPDAHHSALVSADPLRIIICHEELLIPQIPESVVRITKES